MTSTTRPTKKRRELLNFIDGFIKGSGYGPSYREIMRALDYKSVSTIATHIDGLIMRGYLRKRDNSARSLELVRIDADNPKDNLPKNDHVDWLLTEATKQLDVVSDENDRVALLRTIELIIGTEQADMLRQRVINPSK